MCLDFRVVAKLASLLGIIGEGCYPKNPIPVMDFKGWGFFVVGIHFKREKVQISGQKKKFG